MSELKTNLESYGVIKNPNFMNLTLKITYILLINVNGLDQEYIDLFLCQLTAYYLESLPRIFNDDIVIVIRYAAFRVLKAKLKGSRKKLYS